jgi:RNA polymerase sigma-70 factor, ECF subfamily
MSRSTDGEIAELLAEARTGSSASLGRLLDRYANYLKLLVGSQLDKRLQSRLSASDVVQQAFCEAHRDFAAFRGGSPGEFVAWLRRITSNNLLSATEEHLLTEKRDVRRELPLRAIARRMEESALRLENLLADQTETPSEHAVRHEQELLLADALAELPAEYREVIVLRQIDGLAFAEVARRMERSSGAVRMVWLRALRRLRQALEKLDVSGSWV